MQKYKFSATVGGRELSIETGTLAQTANGSCTLRYGDTVLLATAVMSPETRPGMGFFPLMVEFEEKMYAAGRIKGSRFIKREGRPTDEAVLTARFIDRAIRPMFDERMKNEVQVIVTALAFDEANDPDILGLIAASCALHMSDIPWNGPIGAARISKLGNEWLVNPTYEQRKTTDFDLDVSGTKEKVVMIEACANEADEAVMLEAFERGLAEMEPVIKLLEEVKTKVGKEKVDLFNPKTDEEKLALERKAEVEELAIAFMKSQMQELFFDEPKATKIERSAAKSELKSRLVKHLKEKELTDDEIHIATDLIYEFVQNEASRLILEEGKRIDGRALDEVRELQVEVGLLPRVHGSGLFARGETQILSVCTLGAPGDKQTLDGMELVGDKRYMHHYNFPPFAVGEAKPLRGTGRREIGHGALAEKAIRNMIPDVDTFPYTIRVVSETLNSNGSSSMASTCGSTLALMDAGVPIKSPVAGIAMGLASRGDQWKVVTDLQDLEDGPGGMDFKITGTKNGITAIQMDTKTSGINMEIIKTALSQAKTARLHILKQMLAVIPEPRTELSPFAPRIFEIRINPDKIREVIGPGGKMINEIIEKTGVEAIDIEQDGLVMITATDQESGEKARNWVHDLTREVEVGELFEGEVVRLMDFGAFIQVLPGKDGMVHISELAPWRVEKVSDIVKVGDKVKVKVIEIDDQGRINLSMKQAEGNVYTDEMKAKAQSQPPKRPGRPLFGKKPGHRPQK